MATIAQIERGVAKYIDNDMAPKIPTNIPNGKIKKIAAVTGAVYAVRNGLRRAVSDPALAKIGAVDGAGNVDVTGLAEIAAEQIPDDGFTLTVPILGELTFFREDLEKLKSYIVEG